MEKTLPFCCYQLSPNYRCSSNSEARQIFTANTGIVGIETSLFTNRKAVEKFVLQKRPNDEKVGGRHCGKW
uniref:Uncharacterized protein n=1 Tax=Trichuris muris TaxID=70415 RepID=A0A5S6Q5B8_TRIMR